MKSYSLILIAVALTSCASQQQRDQKFAEMVDLRSQMRDSLANSTVTCPDKRTCDKAFTLAKIYVQEHADMKIQSSDDTIVSTYNPTDYGRMALTATRTPESGDSSTIKLVATCKGMDSGSDLFFKMCAERIAPTYKNFKSFIESKMN